MAINNLSRGTPQHCPRPRIINDLEQKIPTTQKVPDLSQKKEAFLFISKGDVFSLNKVEDGGPFVDTNPDPTWFLILVVKAQVKTNKKNQTWLGVVQPVS